MRYKLIIRYRDGHEVVVQKANTFTRDLIESRFFWSRLLPCFFKTVKIEHDNGWTLIDLKEVRSIQWL